MDAQATSVAPPRGARMPRWLPSLPILALALIYLVAIANQPTVTFDSPALLTFLNFVFLTAVPLTAAAVAVDAYRRTGVVAILAIGAAMLATGIGSGVLAAIVLISGGPNATTTLHNTSSMIAGVSHLVAAIGGVHGVTFGRQRLRHVVLVYGSMALAIVGWLILYASDLTPPFWTDGGTTQLRLVVLGAGSLAFGLAAFAWWQTAVRDRSIRFLIWYIPGLAAWSFALAALMTQVVFGGLVGWLGRSGQYIGSVYLLVAVLQQVVAARRSRGEPPLGVLLLQASLPFRPLVESTVDAVVVLGRHGRIVYWNDAARRMFGYETREAFDADPVELLAPATPIADPGAGLIDPATVADPADRPGDSAREALAALLHGATGGAPTRRREIALHDRDGRPVQTEVSVFASPEDDRLTVCVIADVSERVRTREDLERRVRERTKELEGLNARLVKANAAKDEFLGLVSHELKTPITSILAASSILQARLARADADGLLSDVVVEAGRLAGIIDNLLALARLDAGTQPDFEPVALDRVAGRVADEVGHEFPGRQIVVSVERGAVVEGNAGQLAIVVRNFLLNALKYSPQGAPVDVIVRVEGGMASLAVVDQGPGLDPVEAERLFEPFYRGRATSAVSGLGIGLTVCKRIVEAHGGRIGASPRSDGAGSVFLVRLPIAEEEPAELETVELGSQT